MTVCNFYNVDVESNQEDYQLGTEGFRRTLGNSDIDNNRQFWSCLT